MSLAIATHGRAHVSEMICGADHLQIAPVEVQAERIKASHGSKIPRAKAAAKASHWDVITKHFAACLL